MIIIAPHSLSRWRGTCRGDRTTTLARLCHNLRRGLCPHAIKIGHRTEEISALTPRSFYILGPTCWGSIPLYVSFLDYKSEGTLDTRDSSNTHTRHSCLGNTTLSQADVGYYVLAVWTSLDSRVFLRDCVFFHLSRQTSQPPSHLRIRTNAVRHPTGDFSLLQYSSTPPMHDPTFLLDAI